MENLRKSLLKTEQAEEDQTTRNMMMDHETQPMPQQPKLLNVKELPRPQPYAKKGRLETNDSQQNWSGESIKFSMSDAIRRSDNFWLSETKAKKRVLLQLTSEHLSIRELPKDSKRAKLMAIDLDFQNIIGASVEHDDIFVVTTYPLIKTGCCCKSKEKPTERKIHRYKFYAQTEKLALQWTSLVILLLRSKREEEDSEEMTHSHFNKAQREEVKVASVQGSNTVEVAATGFNGSVPYTSGVYDHDNLLNELPRKRKFLAIVNPFAGKKKGLEIWRKARSVFQYAHIDFDERITTSRDDAFLIAAHLTPNEYDAIITLGGDGIIHETVNGLLTRSDWRAVSRIPLVFLPGGTSDGLVASILRSCGLEHSLANAIYLAIKGQQRYMDVVEIQRQDSSKPKIYSVLSVVWGIIADIDVNSESLRCCGNARYDIYGFWRTFCPRLYNGVIRMKGCSSEQEFFLNKLKNEENTTIDFYDNNHIGDWELKDGPFKYLTIHNVPWVDRKVKMAPLSEVNDGFNDIIIMGNVGRCSMAKHLIFNINQGDYFEKKNPTVVRKSIGMEYYRAKAWRLEPLSKAVISPQKSPINIIPPLPRDQYPRHSNAGILRSSSKQSAEMYYESRRHSSNQTPKSSVMLPSAVGQTYKGDTVFHSAHDQVPHSLKVQSFPEMSYQNRHIHTNVSGLSMRDFYSIDGEIYPPERIHGTVLQELLPILALPSLGDGKDGAFTTSMRNSQF